MQQILILFSYFLSLATSVDISQIPKHYQYKYSFKYPYNGVAHHFQTSGDVSFSEKFVRLSSSLPNSRGLIYSDQSVNFKDWMVDFSFKASGRGFLGGDGLAFWLIDSFSLVEGHAIKDSFAGQNSQFKGLGILFDTADPGINRKNPYVYGIINDGSKSKHDYSSYMSHGSNNILGGCISEYRNSPGLAHVRIIYHKKNLQVLLDISHGGKQFQECFSHDNVEFGQYRIGLSAASDEFADDHDVYSFDVQELDSVTSKRKESKNTHTLSNEEKHKIDQFEKLIHQVEDEKDPNHLDLEYGDAVNPLIIQKIQENQFHILEKLEGLESLLYSAQSSSSSSSTHDQGNTNHAADTLSALRNQIIQLSHSLESIESKLEHAASVLNDLENKVHEKMGDVHQVISEASSHVIQSQEQTNARFEAISSHFGGTWSWFKYITSVFGLAIIIYGVLAIIRNKGNSNRNKFV